MNVGANSEPKKIIFPFLFNKFPKSELLLKGSIISLFLAYIFLLKVLVVENIGTLFLFFEYFFLINSEKDPT